MQRARRRNDVVGRVCLIVAAVVALMLPKAARAGDQGPGSVTPRQWSTRMADAEMSRRGDSLIWKEGGKAKWDYAAGLFTLALLKLNERVPDPRYLKFAESAIGSFITPDGGIRGYRPEEYQLDHVNPGKTLLALYRLTGEEQTS